MSESQQPVDTQNLATVVTEWRKIHEEIAQHKQQASEKNKRAKVLEGIIMNIMKQQNLGALVLKCCGGRILYENVHTHHASWLHPELGRQWVLRPRRICCLAGALRCSSKQSIFGGFVRSIQVHCRLARAVAQLLCF